MIGIRFLSVTVADIERIAEAVAGAATTAGVLDQDASAIACDIHGDFEII